MAKSGITLNLCSAYLHESDVGHTTWHVIDIFYILLYALLFLLTSSNNKRMKLYQLKFTSQFFLKKLPRGCQH